MSKPHLIFHGRTLEGESCSSCKQRHEGSLRYTMIYRSDRQDNSHYLMCEHCAAGIAAVCVAGDRKTRAIGDANLPKGEL